MKRAIEQYLLAPLAITIVKNQFPEGDQFLFVRSGGNNIKVDFVDPDLPDLTWEQVQEKERTQDERAKNYSIQKIALDSKGTLAEFKIISEEYNKLNDEVDNVLWRKHKNELMNQMSEPDFWQSAERFEILSEIEFVDRFEAGLETATSIMNRLNDSEKVRFNYPTDLIRNLALRIFLLKKSLDAYNNKLQQDVYMKISIDMIENRDMNEEILFAEKIEKMYRKWAKNRKMRSFSAK